VLARLGKAYAVLHCVCCGVFMACHLAVALLVTALVVWAFVVAPFVSP